MLKTIKLIIILSKSLALTTLTKRFYPKGGKDVIKHAASLVPKTPGVVPNLHNPNAGSSESKEIPIPDNVEKVIPAPNIKPDSTTVQFAVEGNNIWTSTTVGKSKVVTVVNTPIETNVDSPPHMDKTPFIFPNPLPIKQNAITASLHHISLTSKNPTITNTEIPAPFFMEQPNSNAVTPVSLQNILDQAFNTGLIIYEDTKEYDNSGGMVLTKQGYEVYSKINPISPPSSMIAPGISEDNTSNITYIVGTLKIDSETVIPSPKQTHLVVAYDPTNGSRTVIGILTSEKTPNNIMLSKKQPISGKDKEQLFKPLPNPLKITEEQFEKHEQGTEYVQNDAIILKLDDARRNSESKIAIIYDGKGLTSQDLQLMIEHHKKLPLPPPLTEKQKKQHEKMLENTQKQKAAHAKKLQETYQENSNTLNET